MKSSLEGNYRAHMRTQLPEGVVRQETDDKRAEQVTGTDHTHAMMPFLCWLPHLQHHLQKGLPFRVLDALPDCHAQRGSSTSVNQLLRSNER